MNKQKHILLTVGSWEERFFLGAKEILNEYLIDSIEVLYSEEYSEYTLTNKLKLAKLAEMSDISINEISFSANDNKDTWKNLEFNLAHLANSQVLLDISTAPRELIWYLLHYLKKYECKINCIYSKPNSYGTWLSKDPGRPRLIYEHSGITKLDCPTALLLVSGFDIERATQLVQYFEPKYTLLALQEGEQFDNNILNIESNLRQLREICELEYFSINLFDSQAGYVELEKKLECLTDKYNIIAVSLGPKPSAVSLYKLQEKYKEIALCYIPSNRYNTESYSSGFQSITKLDMS